MDINNDYEKLCARYSDAEMHDLRRVLHTLSATSANMTLVADAYEALIADKHENTGSDLLFSVDLLLVACAQIEPSVEKIRDDFKMAWKSYLLADAFSLDDASTSMVVVVSQPNGPQFSISTKTCS